MLNADPNAYTVEHLPPIPAAPCDKHPARRLGLTSSATLMAKDLPPIRYVVPGFIAEGLTLLAGKSKIGKSWLILGTAIAVASGGYAFGSIKVDEGDVLYLALEDNERHLQAASSRSCRWCMLPRGCTSTPLAAAWTRGC